MATLTGQTIAGSYKDLLQVSNSNSGVDATLRTVEDGEGTSAGIQLSATDTSFNNNYILKEQGRQYHVANTMSSPYYSFDGTNDYITLGDNDKLTFTSQLSVSLWFKCNASTIASGEVLIAKYDGTGNNREFTFYFDTDEKLNVGISPTGGDDAVGRATPAISNLDKWNHVAFVWDSDGSTGTIKVYINGIDQTLTGSGTIPTVMVNKTAPLVIGASSTFADNFDGDIAGVKIFNESLSATEVKDLYSGGSVPFKYQGARNTSLVADYANKTGDFGGTTSSDGSITSWTSTTDLRAAMTLTTAMVKGKTYTIQFDLSASMPSGVYCVVSDNTNLSSNRLVLFSHGQSSGTFTTTFVATDNWTQFGFVNGFLNTAGVALPNVTNVYIREIGCVAEFDGTGVASDEWLDKSGNDLHGTVSGATVANAPSGDEGLVYEEGTFTPEWTAGYTGTITYNTSHTRGRYVRVGDQMTVWMDISVSSATSNSDQLTFELPANARAVQNNYVGKIYFQTTSGTLGGTSNILRCSTASADATVLVHQQTTSGNANVTGAMLGNGTVNIFMSYLLA